MKQFVLTLLLALLLVMPITSAVVVDTVSVQPFSPGKEGFVTITIKNVLDEDVKDLTLTLDLSNKQFITGGSSSDSVDELRENKNEDFTFRLRPSYDIKPGDYSIPYTISYTYKGDRPTKIGTIGVQVIAQPELSFVLSEKTPVVGMQGTLTLKVINDGLSDARFVSVRAIPEGFSITSDDQVYVGSVSSDDFETVSFDATFASETPVLKVFVEYRDLNNNKQTLKSEIPFTVYTKEKAIELGLIKRNNLGYYIGIVIILIIVWFTWRAFAKRRRMKARQAS
jgi:hypothetical protein